MIGHSNTSQNISLRELPRHGLQEDFPMCSLGFSFDHCVELHEKWHLWELWSGNQAMKRSTSQSKIFEIWSNNALLCFLPQQGKDHVYLAACSWGLKDAFCLHLALSAGIKKMLWVWFWKYLGWTSSSAVQEKYCNQKFGGHWKLFGNQKGKKIPWRIRERKRKGKFLRNRWRKGKKTDLRSGSSGWTSC